MKLSGYQEEAVARLIEPRKPTPTFACFDVPGAGKTAVAINAHIQQARFPALITVPAHLVLQWRNELLRWDVPEDEIGYCPRGMGPRERLSYLASDRAFQLVTYNMWSSPMYRELLLSYGWSSYSFDESHRLRKGRLGKGGAWTPISHLRTKTRSKHMQTPLWLFSGTPIVKDATDVYPLLHLVNPYRYSSRNDFATEWCRTSTTPYGMHVGPLRDPSRFHALLGRHSIRRSWKEIPELAGLKRRDIQLPVELSPADLARHRGIKRDYRDPLTSLPVYSSSGMIHMLRRVSAAAKCAVLPELIEDHPGRWLILSWYKDTARLAQSSLRNVSLPVSYVDGSTSEGKREKALEIYRKGGILVGTLGALETGLNLQVGYQVAFVEQHWLSTTNEQAVARVLRRGQSQPVLVYWLYCPKSFDMRVRSVADRREADIHRALDGFIDDEEWTE